MWSEFAVVYQISSNLVHAFGLQTPITAECTMRRCQVTAVAMATATWRTYRGHDVMRPPNFHPNRSIDRRVIAFPILCNMAAICHLEYEFCYYGPSTKSTMRFDYRVKIWYRSDIPRRRYYDFIILPLWLQKMPNHAPFLGFFGDFLGGFEPLNIVGRHPNPKKAHPWVTTRHLSHKWLKSVQSGRSCEKKVRCITRTGQDNKKVTKA